jgi:eukaryotic-like serine/threonine-protein kinase
LLEARAAARIKSEHVGKVLDVARLPDGAPYIVMEFLEGHDLGALIEREGAFPVTEAIDLLLQACEALAEAHAAQIVHRDLKPENLFVVTQPDGARSVKVLDFGISKQLGDPARRALTNPTTAVGSPQYMAPEQMRAEEIDTRVDVWALGAILYEMLSGQKAFDAETLPAICARVLSDSPRPLGDLNPTLSPLLVKVVDRCLSKHRTQRFDGVAAFADALAPFGSAQADLSCRRIRALSQSLPRVPAELAETVMAKERVSVDMTSKGVSRTLAGQPRAPEDEPTERKPALWPVFLGAAGTLTLAVLLWNWARTPADRGRAAITLGPEPAAAATNAPVPGPSSEGAAPGAAAPIAVAATNATGASTAHPGEHNAGAPPAAQPQAPTEATPPSGDAPADAKAGPPLGSARRAGKKPPAGTPQPVTAPPVGAAPRPSGDAWDPDNFGSRH